MKPNITKSVFPPDFMLSSWGISSWKVSISGVFCLPTPAPCPFLPSSFLCPVLCPRRLTCAEHVTWHPVHSIPGEIQPMGEAGRREDSSSLLRTLVFSESCVCLLVAVESIDTTKPNMGRSKDLLSATSKENIGDLSQRSIFLNNKTGKALN